MAPPHILARPRLYIDVQHGLCNRLRALASAATIAERTGRALVVVWRTDHHCEARIGDLLRYNGPVIEDDAAADLLRARSARLYNYMEIEPGAQFQEPILAEGDAPQGDVYIRSAYTLTSPHRDAAAERRYLRALLPAEPVCELVSRVRARSDVAVHIRMATGEGFDHLPHESPANWPAHRHRELVEWRRKSHSDRFIERVDTLLAEGAIETVFLAADLDATYARFAERYGDRLAWLERDLFDRSPRQLQYALADLMLLATGRRLLASSYSSFSDMAARIGPRGRRVERSGVDF
ncbi:MAG: hypothetical protein JJT95_15920 [Pararhodobacter sp.]|nr:hypothetical protein [Pararhodobacter sp.]